MEKSWREEYKWDKIEVWSILLWEEKNDINI